MQKVKKTLIHWYQKEGRKGLPWRETDNPYHIYISELMLQQTQVATVLARFYAPFLAQFPTLAALAAAKETQVMKAWQGLGYYQRARNLHRTAQICMQQYGGQLPQNEADLLALPGIGPNTARAILAFAFHQPVAILEANVKRVLQRFYALDAPKPANLWQKAEDFLNKTHSFDHNQAMMDLGAMICTARKPQCLLCPLESACKGKQDPLQYSQTQRKTQPVRHYAIICHHDANGAWAMQPRRTRLLEGMYGFVMQEKTAPRPNDAQLIGHVSHVYSHFKVDGDVYTSHAPPPKTYAYISKEARQTHPHSTLEEKIFRLVDGCVS